jgi:hypothetical protein
MIAGTFSFLFGSVLGVIDVWAQEDKGAHFWIMNIKAGSFQAGRAHCFILFYRFVFFLFFFFSA